MTQRNRVFLGLLGIFILAFGFLTYGSRRIWIPDTGSPRRQPDRDAHPLATLIELDLQNGAIDVSGLGPAFQNLYSRRFSAQVYSVEKTRVELRVYVTDRTGHVVFDAQCSAVGRTTRDGTTSSARWKVCTGRARPMTSPTTRAPQ